MPLPDSVTLLRQQKDAAYYRRAWRPVAVGPDTEYLRLWCRLYEARAALAENNPAFAATLLPAGPVGAPGPGLPLIPAGVRWAVDETAPYTVTVTVEVAGPVTVTITGPSLASPQQVPVTQAATRATATFPALSDGVYTLLLSAGGSLLATVYVPVLRAQFRLLREQSRLLRFGFRLATPRPDAAFVARLARLVGIEACARVGRLDILAQLLVSLGNLPAPPRPVALYPGRYVA